MQRFWRSVVYGLLALVLFSSESFSANKLYDSSESAWKLADAGQAGLTHQITLSSLPAGQGRVSAQIDRGAGSRAGLYHGACTFALTGTLTGLKGTPIEVWVATSDGTLVDGLLGTSDAALTDGTGDRNNLHPVGIVYLDHETTNAAFVGSFDFAVTTRYFSLVVWNTSSQAFAAVGTTPSYCTVTPRSWEVQ